MTVATISTAGVRRFAGLSTDAKPSGEPAGSSFFETDTGFWYLLGASDAWAKDVAASGLGALPAKFAFANIAAATTDGAIVAAVASKKIRVLALLAVTGATATTLVFTSKPAGAGGAISPTFAHAANGGEALPFSPVGWFETVAGEGLSATTGAGSTTGVQVVYVEI